MTLGGLIYQHKYTRDGLALVSRDIYMERLDL